MQPRHLQVTEDMQRLAKQLAERAVHYDTAQQNMHTMNTRHAFHLCRKSTYRETVQQHKEAVDFYKALSQPLYAAAKRANAGFFSTQSGSEQQNLQAERALKSMLNDFVAKIAAQENISPSTFYFYTSPSPTH